MPACPAPRSPPPNAPSAANDDEVLQTILLPPSPSSTVVLGRARPRAWSSPGGCYNHLLAFLILGFYLAEPRQGGSATAAAAHTSSRVGAGYRTDYVKESCRCEGISKQSCARDSFTLHPITHGAGHVALSKGPGLDLQYSCKFTIVAPPNKTIQLVINNISIPVTLGCKSGILRVYDGIPGNGGSELTRACGTKSDDRVVRSKTNQVTLYYYQGAEILWEPKAFNVTYTYVREHRPDSPQSCNLTSEYLCANKLCISRALKCDGYDNCGDRSEELMDVHVCGGEYNKSDPVVGVAIGTSVGVLLAIGLLAAFAYWARRRAGPLFTDAQIHRIQENREGEDQAEQQEDTLAPPTVDLSVPDLTRDLIDRRPAGSGTQNEAANGNVSQSDVSSLDVFPDPKDGPPPSYSSLFPDLV